MTQARTIKLSCGALAYAVICGATVSAQVMTRPYDAAAVRRAAADIHRQVDTAEQRARPSPEEALAGPLQFIVESLSGLTDLSVVPDDVVSAVAALASSGRMASETILRFGDRAVASVVRVAREPRPLYGNHAGELAVLQTMLQRPAAAQTLSPGSKTAIRTLARDVLSDRNVNAFELAGAATLAIATGDPELRAAASRLTDSAELERRGIKPEQHAMIISRIRAALGSGGRP